MLNGACILIQHVQQEVKLEHPKNYKIEDENEKNYYKDIVMECKVVTQKHPRGWDFENNRGSWLEFRPDKSSDDMLWEYKVEAQTEFQATLFRLATTMQVDQVVGQTAPTWQDVVKVRMFRQEMACTVAQVIYNHSSKGVLILL
jgi:hypothetical protein